MAMYIQPTGFVFSNSIHRVNPTATTNVFAKRYDFNLISILPRGGKTSDNGYISMSMTAGGTNYDYHVIKTDPTGDTPLTGCPPTSFTPTAAAGPTTASDPSFNAWAGTPGSNTLTISRTAITPTVGYVCTKTACVPPLEATTVTATPSTICAGQSSSITASGPSSGVSYQVWTAATGGTNLGTTPLSVSPATTTTYYIQTVSNSDGSCVSATRVSVTVTVTPSTTPTFTAVSPICSGGSLSALPTTSNNGITGTWSPALNNTTTTTYTFTPTAGQCATTTTLSITVNPNVTPTFTAVSPICSGGSLSALPTTSNNGITGTWSPALDNTTTTTYTFTPTAGQCATTTTLSITVNPNVTPTFTAVSPICSGGSLSALPTISNNGITGTWSPALDNTTTTTYTFTPTAGQCATTTTLSITVNPNVTPTFTAVSPICSGGSLSALPTTSNNGITGTWSPALDNTTTTTYTFTPTAGQCATTTTLSITVNPNVTPTFAAVAPICTGDALSPLPTTSTNGITGTWSPALDNTTTTTYTFTPTAGQCATTTTLSITVNPNVTPTFAAVAPICTGDALSPLPTTSTNGITGTWSPALDNTTTTTYTFTPTAGQCATTTTLTISVNSTPATPTFTAVAPICIGDALAPLPTTSTNGITGTWSPALDSTTTTTYTFTPTAGQCATTTTLTITVNTSPTTPTFTAVAPICIGDVLAPLPTTSTNGITGTWSPALDNTTTTTYTFTPTAGQCATTTTLTITVNSTPATPTFTAVSTICSGATLTALPTTSNNGITGTWSPALNNTTTTTYTFTPTAGQCATTTTLTITVNPNVTPTFTSVSPICSGDALSPLPTTSTNGITGTWSPALDNTTTTTYTFTPTTGVCATTTTLTITVTTPTTPTFTAVSPICSGDALSPLPTTSINGVSGTWSPALDNTTTTTYTFTPTAGQCATTTTMTITVSAPPVAVITGTSSICFGQTASLTASGGSSYTWSTGANTTSISSTPSDTITYWVIASTGSCSDSTSYTVNVIQNPNVVVTPAISTTIIQGNSIELTASGASSYTWTPSEGLSCTACPVTIASPEVTTVYCASTTVNGCVDTTCVIVNVDIICGELFVPSAFSPNSDGVNDCLSVYNNCIESMDFKVFSRWGEVVYQSIDVNDCWDGTFKGTALNTAVFVYKLDAVLLNGEEVKLKGNVSLIK
ncbi:MAG: gliding motility-associated C-terminal domain-containing protein [Flavobacteriales bacterium]|nr:gliding motility-associated C-terminal domain-containing protein [Flavobacteriales bacterium]